MGLDMYLCRVTKLTDEEKAEVDKMTVKELNESEYDVFTLGHEVDNADEYDTDENLEELMPYMYKIKREQDYINLTRLKKEHGVPEDAKRVGECFGEGQHTMWFRKDGQKYEINLTAMDDEMQKRVTDTIKDVLGVFKMEEVAYWRKNYGLQQKMHDSCDVTVENCGYYKMNDFMKKSVRDENDGYEDLDMEETDDSAVFYHEWY